MLALVSKLKDLRLRATDGEIGQVADLYFDDESWTVRYLVAKTGGWLSGRQVLISPAAVAGFRPEAGNLAVRLTIAQIEASPPVDADLPVSRQREADLHAYYGWPYYWAVTPPPGDAPLAGAVAAEAVARDQAAARVREQSDPNLRSAGHVAGYGICALDGEIGHVEDFLIDVEPWAVRYMVVDTRKWLPGKKVLLAPRWIRIIDWGRRQVVVDVTGGSIRAAPAFDDAGSIDRNYETKLHRHFSKTAYWIGSPE